MSKYIKSDARTEVEPEWMSIPHFLTWPDSSNWEEVKHMECGNFVSSVISRALFRYPSMFPSSLSKSAGSSELRHEFQARPRACMSPSTFCCCCLQRRISWILTKPRGLLWGMAPHKRNGEIPFLVWKNPLFSVALQIALEGRERLSWAAAEGGFEEDQCCWGAAGWDVLLVPELYLFSQCMAGLLPLRKYKS